MSSDKQIEANRLNAQRSTGPRTPAGKAKVSSNALKHWLTARDVVLPNENPDKFESFREDLLSNLDPQGELEGVLAEKIVADFWRLRRVPIFEATLYRRGFAELLARQAAKAVAVREYESTEDPIVAALKKKRFEAQYGRVEDAEQTHAREQAQLDDHLTRMLEEHHETFKNLWRQETALSRSILRMWHELERLQARRAGEHVPAPAVMDVNVHLPEDARPDIGATALNGETDRNQQQEEGNRANPSKIYKTKPFGEKSMPR